MEQGTMMMISNLHANGDALKALLYLFKVFLHYLALATLMAAHAHLGTHLALLWMRTPPLRWSPVMMMRSLWIKMQLHTFQCQSLMSLNLDKNPLCHRHQLWLLRRDRL
jgi:hypothetical protein